MAKELIWTIEKDKVYGWAREFKNHEEFIETVKDEYENGDIEVTDVKIEMCIYTQNGIDSDMIIPINETDITIEQFITGNVEHHIEEE